MTPENLPDAELDVLAVLWHRGDSTARRIRETLEERRPMSQGALLALLARLEAKKCVAKTGEKVGKAFVYRASIEPGPTFRERLNQLTERLFDGNPLSLVHNLFESRPPSDDDLEALEKMIQELKTRRKKS